MVLEEEEKVTCKPLLGLGLTYVIKVVVLEGGPI
jgi:hypothetical protein